jgi:hypothetical protein
MIASIEEGRIEAKSFLAIKKFIRKLYRVQILAARLSPTKKMLIIEMVERHFLGTIRPDLHTHVKVFQSN